MLARTCLAVDSACDLPTAFFNDNRIKIFPINLNIGSKIYRDVRDPKVTMEMYRSQRLEESFDAESEPASVTELAEFVEKELMPDYDEVLALTISSKRSGVFKNLRQSAFVECQRIKAIRKKQGIEAPFKIKVVDSASIFTGQGVLTFEAVRLFKQGKSIKDIIARIESVKSRVHAYLAPDSLYFLKNRARAKGDNSVSWLSYQLGNVMDIKPIVLGHDGITEPVAKVRGHENGIKYLINRADEAIAKGLEIPVVVMSFAGDPRRIQKIDAYQEFIERCRRKSVTSLLSVMSTTGAINVGPGAFSLAYAGK
jgi:DegV family protein with EDD domain